MVGFSKRVVSTLALCATCLLVGCGNAHAPPAKPSADTPEAVARTVQMVDIPAGKFMMGTDPQVSFQNGFPPHSVRIQRFRMARYDVTFDEYDVFARATHRPLPPDD